MTARPLLPPSFYETFSVSRQKTEVVLGIGTTRVYQLRKDGELESYKDGGSRKFTVRSIEAYLQRQLEAERTARAAVAADIARPAADPTLEKTAHKSDLANAEPGGTPATAPPTTPSRRKRGRPPKMPPTDGAKPGSA